MASVARGVGNECHELLTLPDGTPFSEVVETYTDKVLAFPMTPPEQP